MKTKSLETLLAEKKAKADKKESLAKELARIEAQIALRQKEDRRALATAIGYVMVTLRDQPEVLAALKVVRACPKFKQPGLLDDLLAAPVPRPDDTV
ncbi:MAG: hypothetical protein H3C27_01300 [Opitutaceae bacterium]|nr:hypothetical protein [Opitutaceae bacterium]